MRVEEITIPGRDGKTVTVFEKTLSTRERSRPTQRIDLSPTNLVFSFEHQIRVDDE